MSVLHNKILICLESFVSKMYSTNKSKDLVRMNKNEAYIIVESIDMHSKDGIHMMKSKLSGIIFAVRSHELKHFTPIEEYREKKIEKILN